RVGTIDIKPVKTARTLSAWFDSNFSMSTHISMCFIKASVRKKKKKSFGDRSFSVAAPTLWNALPVSLRSIKCISTFKSNLKTYLFKLAFNIS
ncbi:unnamed protein product, partial [Porites evermanni]